MNPLTDFVEGYCTLVSEAWVESSNLWEAYLTWCTNNPTEYHLSRKAFARSLQGLGCRQGKRERGNVRVWEGIELYPIFVMDLLPKPDRASGHEDA